MKTITLHCDGEDCTTETAIPCNDRHVDVCVPGWLRRRVVDLLTNAAGVALQDDDACFHYCPACAQNLGEPPLSSALRRHLQPDEA